MPRDLFENSTPKDLLEGRTQPQEQYQGYAPNSLGGYAATVGSHLLKGAGNVFDLGASLATSPFRMAHQAYQGTSPQTLGGTFKDIFMGYTPASESFERLQDAGIFRKPQSRSEEALGNISQFAGAGAFGGAQGLKTGLQAGLGSEALGQVAREEIPEYENYARLIGALGGPAVWQGAKKTGEIGKNILKAQNKGALADKLLESKSANEAIANKNYAKVEEGVKDLGISKFKFKAIEPKNKQVLYDKLDNDSVKIIKRWEHNPNFRNTKDLYSELARFDRKNISKLDKSIYGTEAVNAAQNLRGNLYDTLEKALGSFGKKGKDVFSDLKAADTHYFKSVVPFKNEKVLFDKFKEGYLTKEELVSALAKNKAAASKKYSFSRTEIGKQFPELNHVDKQYLVKALELVKKGTIPSALGYYIFKDLIGGD